jgi:hypothetical protein
MSDGFGIQAPNSEVGSEFISTVAELIIRLISSTVTVQSLDDITTQ